MLFLAMNGSLSFYYFGVLVEGFAYGDWKINMSSNCIVDSGTNVLILPDEVYASYVERTNSTIDSTTGLLVISPQDVGNLKPFTFDFGEVHNVLFEYFYTNNFISV